MMREKSSYSFLSSSVKGQDKKELTGVFCTVGGILVDPGVNYDGQRRSALKPIS
jgi:hypothetical protein